MMFDLTADEWIEIRGAPVAMFKAGRLPPDQDPRALDGQTVRIDGQRYLVTGVEAHAVVDVRGQPFGLMVEIWPTQTDVYTPRNEISDRFYPR